MTDEEIKQRAEEHANKVNKFAEDESVYLAAKDGYLSGAHSRDEEIKGLNNLLEARRESLFQSTKRITELEMENNQLRNPWISVKDRLPEMHSRVLIMFCNGIVTYNDYIGIGDINYMKSHSETITHWMLIPELKKGE